MQRSALLAGATGLVGRALLPLLLERHTAVHLLLRRDADGLPGDPKLQRHVVDFAQLPTLPALDECCLGTTIGAAGSQAAFRAVDFDAVLATARAAMAQRWLQPVGALIPARWRPIAAETVARGLLQAMHESRPGTRIVESAELQVLGR